MFFLRIPIILFFLLSGSACAGNITRVDLLVVDENGSPLDQVNVAMGFLSNTPNNNYRGVTNSDGKVFAVSDSVWGVKVYAEKPDYYDSFKRIENGNQSLVLPLRRIMRPKAMYAKKAEVILPQKGVLYGFDFSKGDLVVPYGEGLTPHVRLMVDGEKQNIYNYEKTLTVSFAENDGILKYDSEVEVRESKFKFPYLVPESGYQNTLEKHEKRWQKQVGYGYDHGLEGDFDQFLLGYAFRVSSTLDESGNLASANYGKVYGEFSAYLPGMNTTNLSDGQAKVVFTYSYNPTKNERSLEFDVSKNLFDRLPPELDVSAP